MNRNVQYMLLGLGAAWLIMFIYVVLITLRERKLRKELDRVRRMVEHPTSRRGGFSPRGTLVPLHWAI